MSIGQSPLARLPRSGFRIATKTAGEAIDMGRVLAFLAVLVAGLFLAWFGERLPTPLPATAPPTVFSAGRAMSDVRVIAREPHPVGSAANARVRDHLIARLSGMGLA